MRPQVSAQPERDCGQRKNPRIEEVRENAERDSREKGKRAENKLERLKRPQESRKGKGRATRNWGLVTGAVRWPRVGDEARVGS